MTELNSFYQAYGASLASRLRAISHTESSPRFIFVGTMDSPEEVIKAQTTGLKPEMNVLVWERFSEQLSSGRRDNYNTRPQGSLAVIRKPQNNTPADREAAIDQCRTVALKVMALMLADEQDPDSDLGQETIRFEFDGQSGESIPMLHGGWMGYGFSFDWLVPLDLELTEDDLI